jgi:hypothetical protein
MGHTHRQFCCTVSKETRRTRSRYNSSTSNNSATANLPLCYFVSRHHVATHTPPSLMRYRCKYVLIYKTFFLIFSLFCILIDFLTISFDFALEKNTHVASKYQNLIRFFFVLNSILHFNRFFLDCF